MSIMKQLDSLIHNSLIIYFLMGINYIRVMCQKYEKKYKLIDIKISVASFTQRIDFKLIKAY